MSVIDHPRLKYTPKHEQWHEPCQVVQCDFCRCLAPVGHDMHDAVTRAQKAGYKTVRGDTPASPRKWACPRCQEQNTTG